MSISFVYASNVKNPLKFFSFNLKHSMVKKKPLSKICQNKCFLRPVHSDIRRESLILSLSGNMWVRQNPCLCSEQQEHLVMKEHRKV